MSNYTYTDGAVHNDHHKEMNIHVSGKTDMAALLKAFMAEEAEEVFPEEAAEHAAFPEILCTPQAQALLAKLRDAGMVDDRWNPLALSNAEKGTLAEYIAEKLDIHSKWKFFGHLWKTDSETLRTSKTRGLEQEKTWKFRSKLEAL